MKEAKDISKTRDSGHTWGSKRLSIAALQLVILLVLWLVLSGHYDAEHIIIGVVSAGLVTLLTSDIFYTIFDRNVKAKVNPGQSLLQLWRFLLYLPWLLSRIIMANVQVAWLVIHPKMPIDPVILQFRTTMKKDFSRVMLANSITLTPGTITLNLEDDYYSIHTLAPPSAQELVEAVMQNRVGAIFLEEPEKPPSTNWAYSIKEMKV
ncbi:Na+/H+ antiporter subunit E [Chloroflexota bacterium]